MTVKELIELLQSYPQDAKVNIEMDINGLEFDTELTNIYESGDIYLYGKDTFDVNIYDKWI